MIRMLGLALLGTVIGLAGSAIAEPPAEELVAPMSVAAPEPVKPLPPQCAGCVNPCREHVPGIARYAKPSENPQYIGYYVGGGCHRCKGEYRGPDEGTWGWDYQGWCPRAIVLKWCHCRRYQGGRGAYYPDGPVKPEPLYVPKHEVPKHEGEE